MSPPLSSHTERERLGTSSRHHMRRRDRHHCTTPRKLRPPHMRPCPHRRCSQPCPHYHCRLVYLCRRSSRVHGHLLHRSWHPRAPSPSRHHLPLPRPHLRYRIAHGCHPGPPRPRHPPRQSRRCRPSMTHHWARERERLWPRQHGGRRKTCSCCQALTDHYL